MKKKLILVSLIMVMLTTIMILSACGDKNKPNDKAETTKQADKNKEEEQKKAEDKKKQEDRKREEAKAKLVENKTGIPVLYYHSVNDDNPKNDELVIATSKFREQIKYLKDNGYNAISMETLYNYLSKGEKVPEKSIVITLDDGWKDNYKNAFPILKEFGFTATVFVISEMTKTNHWLYLSEAEIKEMVQGGMEIESHTVMHENLSEVSPAKLKSTLEESKKYLEGVTGKTVETIAYPFGKYNKKVIEATKAAGYKMAFTINGPWANKENSPLYEVRRIYVNSHYTMDIFKERVTNHNYKR